MPTSATGHFVAADWKESRISPEQDTPGLSHATVSNTFSGAIQAVGTVCAYEIVYLAEMTGTFTGMEVISGSLDGHKGSFAVEQHGVFEADGTLRCTFEVVPGSGSGELAGLTGTGSFTTRNGDTSVPYTFDYDLT